MSSVLIALLLIGPLEPGQLDLAKLNLTYRSSDERPGGDWVPERQIFGANPGNTCLPLKTWFTLGFGTKVRLESLPRRRGEMPRVRAARIGHPAALEQW
jgi:hypothetical protein